MHDMDFLLIPTHDFDEEGNNTNRRLCFGMECWTFVWLFVFCATGVGLGLCYEFLEIHSFHHAPGASADSFFLVLLGYWSQALFGFAFAFSKTNFMEGAWSKPVIAILLLSSICDGIAQALDFVGQVEGGYMLFTIFHSSVTLFSCIIAICMVKNTFVSRRQWFGISLIVVGLLATSIPNPVSSPGSFFTGLFCSLGGSLLLAASYPLSELVFRISKEKELGQVREETACFLGALINSIGYSLYTIFHTIPHWKKDISDYIKPGSSKLIVTGYVMYGILVGLHSLSFWKSVNRLGTVPTAVAKGAQQAGVFVFSHVVFCSIDPNECIFYNHGDGLWNKMQKSVAASLCLIGVLIYSLSKEKKGTYISS